MWTREELKANATSVLKRIYWKAFWISLVIAIAGGNLDRNYNLNHSSTNLDTGTVTISIGPLNYFVHKSIFTVDVKYSILFIAGITLLLLLFRIILGYSLQVGGLKYFVQSAQLEDNKKCFSFAFISQNYKGIVLSMLLRTVKIFLWSLLLIVPGIIKAYAYRMVPFILADNPGIGPKQALEISEAMTNGHKFNIFILDLSFIGWYLLGALIIVGGLFVMPYETATNAELYLVLRKVKTETSYYTYEDIILKHNGKTGNE